MAHSHSNHEPGHHAHGHKHGRFQVSRKTRLRAVIAISFCFFAAEISVGFYTSSLALVADAFHYVSPASSYMPTLYLPCVKPLTLCPAQRPHWIHRGPGSCPGDRAQDFTSRSLLWLGAGLTPRRLLQRLFPSRPRRQHHTTIYRALHLH